MSMRLAWAMVGITLLLVQRARAECPIADVKLKMGTDASFDRPTTSAVLELIARVAPLDAERARTRSPDLGRELNDLIPMEPYVSPPAFRLAVRLRQLDCAVLRGTPIDFDLFTRIANEASNHGLPPPPSTRLPIASLPVTTAERSLRDLITLGNRALPRLPLTQEEHLARARRQRIVAGVLFGLGAVAFGGAAYVTVDAIRNGERCDAPDAPLFCDLGTAFEGVAAVLLHAAAIGTILPAGLLMRAANRHEDAAQNQVIPILTWRASPTGVTAGLRFSF